MSLPSINSDIPALEIMFQGEELVLDSRGCLYWPKEKLMAFSDLHLEKGSSLAARNSVFMPPYDSHATLEKMALCIADWMPKSVVSLGDSFHDDHASGRLPENCMRSLRTLMAGREWVWICGNHDPSPPDNLGGTHCSEVMIGPLNFLHEPDAVFRYGEIAGHLHPAGKIRRRGKAVRRRCFVGDGRRLIMPAFGAFTGGLNVMDEAFEGLFNKPDKRAWFLGQDAVYEIQGNNLVL